MNELPGVGYVQCMDTTNTGTRCEVCGNDYDLAFEVHAQGAVHVFDSFECAIHKLAPVCEHCRCKVIGHGVQAGGQFFCCAHCARQAGVEAIRDRT